MAHNRPAPNRVPPNNAVPGPMTFPDEKFADIISFYDAYGEQVQAAMASVDRAALARAAALLDGVYAKGATLYVAGNGGSAAIADTFVADHAKLVQTDTHLKPRVVSLVGNTSMVTAIANDLAYDQVFVYQLQTYAKSGDALVLISASGSSPNVVNAAAWAKENGIDVIAFTGFDGGKLTAMTTVSLHVTADNYGVIEDVHQGLMHTLAQYIRLSHMDEATIRARKF